MKDKTSVTKKELVQAFTLADKKLETAQRDLDYLKTFIARFPEIIDNFSRIEEFYHSEIWMQGHESLSRLSADRHFASAGEDSIWDASQQFYFYKLKLLKLLSDDLNKMVPEEAIPDS